MSRLPADLPQPACKRVLPIVTQLRNASLPLTSVAALECCPAGQSVGEASHAISKRLHELLATVAMQASRAGRSGIVAAAAAGSRQGICICPAHVVGFTAGLPVTQHILTAPSPLPPPLSPQFGGYIFRLSESQGAYLLAFGLAVDAVRFCHSAQALLMYSQWPADCADYCGKTGGLAGLGCTDLCVVAVSRGFSLPLLLSQAHRLHVSSSLSRTAAAAL